MVVKGPPAVYWPAVFIYNPQYMIACNKCQSGSRELTAAMSTRWRHHMALYSDTFQKNISILNYIVIRKKSSVLAIQKSG